MSADKRTPHTDALDSLGFIHTKEEKRDAIHLGVEPVTAGQILQPGQDIYLKDGLAFWKKPRNSDPKYVGIVDPFLKEPVKTGERFWLVVYPRQITSLRHVWTHPDFPEIDEVKENNKHSQADIEKSEAWLRHFVDTNDCPHYDVLIAAASGESYVPYNKEDDWYYGYCKDGEFLHFSGWDAHGSIPSEFWDHLEIVTGKTFSNDERPLYFSCSC